MDFHIQTRQTQFRIPTELAKKNFKTIQKLIEKQKKLLVDEIAKVKASNIPTATKLEVVRKLIRSFEAFQKKLKAACEKDVEYRSRLEARRDNLQILAECEDTKDLKDDDHEEQKSLDLHNPRLINWYRDQTNLLIIDYLIKSNSRKDYNLGLALLNNLSVTNPGISKLIDADLFESFNKVFVSIVHDHDLSLVITWFNENKNVLKKANSNLEFEINYCQFLSLIDKGDVNEAINFSQANLSPYGNIGNYLDSDLVNHEYNLNRLKEIGGLLVYMAIDAQSSRDRDSFSSHIIANSPRYHEYQRLLSNERWNTLSQCFIENFTKLYSIPKHYPLFIYLSAGLSSLKTKSCYHNDDNTIFRADTQHEDSYIRDMAVLTDPKFRGPNQYYKLLNKINNCPVCSPELYNLSRNLPYAQLITSVFNNPFKLPNGNIYPFDKLLNPSEKYLSEKNTLLRMGKIKDPLTREIFLIDNCIRVYPA